MILHKEDKIKRYPILTKQANLGINQSLRDKCCMYIQSLNSLLRRVSSKVTLPTMLIVPFVVQIFTAVGLVGYFSYQHGQRAVNDLATQLRREISWRIHQKLDQYLAIPHQINQINLRAHQLGILDLEDFQTTGKFFWEQLQAFEVGYINFGNTKGEFIGAGIEKGQRLISEKLVNRPYNLFAVDAFGNRLRIVTTKPEANPNDAEWYHDAVKIGRPVWSEVYNWEDSPEVLAISSSHPVYNQKNQLLGVLGVDLILSEISYYLRETTVSKSGKTFIIEPDGELVASSSDEEPFILDKGQAKRIQASQLKAPLIRESAIFLKKRFGDLKNIDSIQQVEFSINGKKRFLQVTPWQDSFGLNWLIVVVVPESDFMEKIHENTRTTLVLSFLTLIVTTGVGIITARCISQPITDLSYAAKKLARQAATADFSSQELEPDTSIYKIEELVILAESFKQMAKQITSAFTDLETINNELENRVALGTAELRATQNELLALLGAMTELIMVYDIEGRCLRIIQTHPELLFKPANEVIGKTLHEIFTKEKSDFFLASIQDALFNKKSVDIEYQLTIANIEYWFSATLSPIDDKSIISVTRDISQRKKAEIALEQALLTAQSASQAKSAFLSKMSHELRTPLNVILGFTQVMVRDNSLTAEQRENVNIIYRSGSHLLQLINDVLSMSKIEAGQITLHENSFNLPDFLTSIQKMLLQRATAKGLTIACDIPSTLPEYIQTDESKLRQVLINLLGNAIKFTDKGLIILRVAFANDRGETTLNFEIEDTGAGISSEEIKSLFTPFMQTSLGRQSMEGTGLGLAISQQFVQAMGGKITVSSTLSKGSIFQFNIPIKLVEAVESKPASKFEKVIGLEANQPHYRILIVEDVAEISLFLQRMLVPLGFEVRVANNGMSGVQMWSAWQPHLILMDMLMPVMDGYEATRLIKSKGMGNGE